MSHSDVMDMVEAWMRGEARPSHVQQAVLCVSARVRGACVYLLSPALLRCWYLAGADAVKKVVCKCVCTVQSAQLMGPFSSANQGTALLPKAAERNGNRVSFHNPRNYRALRLFFFRQQLACRKWLACFS